MFCLFGDVCRVLFAEDRCGGSIARGKEIYHELVVKFFFDVCLAENNLVILGR